VCLRRLLAYRWSSSVLMSNWHTFTLPYIIHILLCDATQEPGLQKARRASSPLSRDLLDFPATNRFAWADRAEKRAGASEEDQRLHRHQLSVVA
jgi:hypothetical protein